MDRGCGSERPILGPWITRKLMTLVGKQIADSRVLKLIQQMLKAGYEEKGQRFDSTGNPARGRHLATAEQYPADSL